LQLESLRKTIPSGGGRHPTEVFVAVIDQKFGLREGLYHYNVQFNSLDLLAEISLPDLNAVADLPADTEAVLFFASFSERAMWRYRDPRSWRAFVIDVGHIETMCGVVCKALNYSLELCHGFNNIEAAELLNLDNMRTPVMSMAAIRSMDGTVHRRSEGTVAQQGAHEAPLPGQKANHSRILNQSQIANQSQISNQSQVSNPMGLLQTSSLLFMRSTDGTLVDGRHCQQSLSLDDIELLSFFAEPSSLEQGKEAGFDEDRIENAKSLGYLVDCNKDEIPHAGIWETYNLQRAACLMYETIGGGTRRNSFYPPVQNTLGLTDNFSALLNRRTERFFSNKAVSSETFSQVLEEMRQALEPYPWLSLRIVAQGVEGLDASVYSQDRETGKLTKTVETYTRKELLECAHGQWWLNGGGFCCFFVVSLEELARQNKAGIFPSNYFEMLLLLGEAGQALLNVATASGLGSWMTPAVSETIAAKILALNGSEEALYFFKIGIPDEGTKDSSDKRSPLEH
jgi:SagB-type dehydrogenase family enzyme